MPRPPSHRLLLAQRIAPNPRHPLDQALTVHPWHELVLLVRGCYRAELADGAVPLNPGDLLLIPAGTRHRGVIPRDGSMAYQLLQWHGPCPVTVATRLHDGDGRLSSALDWLIDRHEGAAADGRTVTAPLLAALLGELRLQVAGDAAPADRVEAARRFLERHLHYAALDLDELAHRAGLGRSRFSALFSARYDLPPMRYLRERRLTVARRLRAAGGLTLAEIGQRVGILDPAYLARLLGRTSRTGAGAVERQGEARCRRSPTGKRHDQ